MRERLGFCAMTNSEKQTLVRYCGNNSSLSRYQLQLSTCFSAHSVHLGTGITGDHAMRIASPRAMT